MSHWEFVVVLRLENYLNLFLLIFGFMKLFIIFWQTRFLDFFFLINFCSFLICIVFSIDKNI